MRGFALRLAAAAALAAPVSPASPAVAIAAQAEHRVAAGADEIEGVVVEDDRTLVLYTFGGVCHHEPYVLVEEDAGTVRVTVMRQDNGGGCVAMLLGFRDRAALSAPLGARVVIDGATGRPAPMGPADSPWGP